MRIKIKHRLTGEIAYECEAENILFAVKEAVSEDADLSGANLRNADLRNAYLGDAHLRSADLHNADLGDADLSNADLSNADLSDADLSNAYLGDADLSDADLSGADLRNADLGGAVLGGAKNYSENHDFFFELVRRQKTETITESEWSIIGKLKIHRLCWPAIKKRFGKTIIPLFETIDTAGFGDFLTRYKEVLNEDNK